MTNVVPFTPRASAGGGWTAAERERLSDLADRLSAAHGVRVDAVYGVSDDGDPWCVIKDEHEDVLVHIARIDGQFVIHDSAADAIQEGETLWGACDRLLGPEWREPRGDVVISLSARQAQYVVALAVAAAFIHDIEHAEAAPAESAVVVPVALGVVASLAPLAVQAHEPGDHRNELLGAQGAHDAKATAAPAPADLAPTSVSEPVQADAPEEAPTALEDLALAQAAPENNDPQDISLIRGTAGADTLQGGDDRDRIYGGDGNDSIDGGAGTDTVEGGAGNDTVHGGGAAPGEFDLLSGGAGDDQIELAADVVAIGGAGADTFVLSGPANAEGLLGVILDFVQNRGDRLLFGGRDVAVVAQAEEADILGGFGGGGGQGFNAFGGPGATTTATPGYRLAVDLDGDGIADGHIFVGRPGGAAPAGPAAETPGGWDGELSMSKLYPASPPPGDFGVG